MSRRWEFTPPTAQAYVDMREACDLGQRTIEAAEIGLTHYLWCTSIYENEELIGMARLIGDGGCFVELVDVMVHPALQREGLGSKMLEECLKWSKAHLPKSCLLTLISSKNAQELYAKHGFQTEIGMVRFV